MIGAGLDLGQGRRGVDMGPSAIRYAELNAHLRELGLEVDDWGDVRLAGSGDDRGGRRERALPRPDHAGLRADRAEGRRRGAAAGTSRSCSAATTRSRWARSAAWPRRAGRRRALDRRPRRPEPARRPRRAATCTACRSPPHSAQAGRRFASDAYPVPSVTRAALVGVRSLDQGERDLIRELDLRVFTMSEIDKLGVERVMREALAYLAGASRSCTSASTSTRSTRCSRPASARRCAAACPTARRTSRSSSSPSRALLDSLDVVEVNPILDRENETGQARGRARRERARRTHPLVARLALERLLGADAGRLVVDRPLQLLRQAVDVEARPGRRAGRRSPRRGRARGRRGYAAERSAAGGRRFPRSRTSLIARPSATYDAFDFGARARYTVAWARLCRASGRPTCSTACAAATATSSACGSALPMSSEASTIIRRTMKRASSPPSSIAAR